MPRLDRRRERRGGSRGSPASPFCSSLGSLALWFAEPGVEHAVAIALVAFAIGTIGVEFATVFTNAMMPDLVPEERLGRLSGTGWAVGYVGGLVSLVFALGFLVADPVTRQDPLRPDTALRSSIPTASRATGRRARSRRSGT